MKIQAKDFNFYFADFIGKEGEMLIKISEKELLLILTIALALKSL